MKTSLGIAMALAMAACSSTPYDGSAMDTGSTTSGDSLMGGDDLLRHPLANTPHYWMTPNQIASEPWIQIDEGFTINGHISESFSHFEYWPNLVKRLAHDGAGFGVQASEIGFMHDSEILAFRKKGIAFSSELPGMTQCTDGYVLAQLELAGPDPNGVYSKNFHIDAAAQGRPDPTLGGWMVTADKHRFYPDELVLDERLPGLLPLYEADGITIQTIQNADGTTQSSDTCPDTASFNPGVDKLTGLINDYAEFADVVKRTYPSRTKLSMHWAVNESNWEYRDAACLAQSRTLAAENEVHPLNAYNGVEFPCYLGVTTLDRVVSAMCAVGNCPSAVYMDMDYVETNLHNAAYVLESLRRDQIVLAKYGVPMALDLVDQNRDPHQAVNQAAETLFLTPRSSAPNLNDQESMLNVADFFQKSGFLTSSSPFRIESWQPLPAEQGAAVSETNAGSFASTATRMLNEYIENPARASGLALPAIPIYRLYNTKADEHLESLAAGEASASGFASEGVELLALAAAPGLVPFYRCHSTSHFLSLDSDCETFAVESTLPMGYLSPDGSVPGTKPLYRLYNPTNGDHMVSFDPNEGSIYGYSSEGVMGYALSPP